MEARVPRENQHRHKENMKTTDKRPDPGIRPRTFLLWGDSAYHYTTLIEILWDTIVARWGQVGEIDIVAGVYMFRGVGA